ncbi:MAG: MBL fold metallo-hydrolase, partial [Parcubacteria group bacterium]
KKFEELLTEKKIMKIKAEWGLAIKLGEAAMDVLDPQGAVPDGIVKDTNAYSVVTRLVFGKNTFLFTGDFPETKEDDLIASGVDLKSTVLKVAHHGSKYATSDKFLQAVSPQWVILSVGKNNRFGHPAPELLERLRHSQAEILRTDEQGDVEFACPSVQENCAL